MGAQWELEFGYLRDYSDERIWNLEMCGEESCGFCACVLYERASRGGRVEKANESIQSFLNRDRAPYLTRLRSQEP